MWVYRSVVVWLPVAGVRHANPPLPSLHATSTCVPLCRLREEQDLLRVQVAQLEQDRQTVDRQRQELEEGYAANISTQSTVQKAAKNLVCARATSIPVLCHLAGAWLLKRVQIPQA